MLEIDASCWVWSLTSMWMSPALKDLDGLCYLGWSLYSITYPTGRKGQRRGEILPLPAGNALFQKYNFPAKRYVFSKRRTALLYKFAEVPDLVAFPWFFTKATSREVQGPVSVPSHTLGIFSRKSQGGKPGEQVVSVTVVVGETNQPCFKGRLNSR